MKKSYITSFILSTVFLSTAFAQTTVNLTPVADNSIYSNTVGNSSGVGKLFSGQTCSSGNRRALLKFDLSSIPAAATITAVSLAVTVDNVSTNVSASTYNIHPLTLAFGEGTSNGGGSGAAAVAPDATWNDAMLGTSTWTTPGGDFTSSVSSVLMNTSTGLQTFPSSASFVALTQNWLATPANNFGLIMIGDETNTCTARRFGSKDLGTAPILAVTYTCGTTGTDVKSACDSYLWIDGNTYTSSNNTATHTLVNAAGCDSVVTLNLTINNTATTTDVQVACNSYTWIDGNSYTANNNTATFLLSTIDGCDSIINLDLTLTTIDNTVTLSAGGDSLTANQSGAIYQWLDCDNANAIMVGATNKVFVATNPGNYTVELVLNGCVDTSACEFAVKVDEVTSTSTFNIYPNPVKENLMISATEKLNSITVYGVNGQVVINIATPTENARLPAGTEVDVSKLVKGMYIIKVQTNKGTAQMKFIKE